MRKFSWLVGVTLALAWAGSAQAQTTSTTIFKFPKNFNINVTPSITNNSPMDYRNPNAPIGGTTYRPNTTGTAFPFKLSSMFFQSSQSNSIASTTTAGHSTFPTPAQMQAASPSYFTSFQMYRAPLIQP